MKSKFKTALIKLNSCFSKLLPECWSQSLIIICENVCTDQCVLHNGRQSVVSHMLTSITLLNSQAEWLTSSDSPRYRGLCVRKSVGTSVYGAASRDVCLCVCRVKASPMLALPTPKQQRPRSKYSTTHKTNFFIYRLMSFFFIKINSLCLKIYSTEHDKKKFYQNGSRLGLRREILRNKTRLYQI